MVTGTWQAYLDEQFPGFLLPYTERCRLTRGAAEAFLEHLGLDAANLPLLRGLSLLAAHDDALHDFATFWLPELVRSLPSRSRVEQRTWRGGFHGRLNVPATMQLHASGDRSAFVTRARRREFDLPENVLVRSLAGRTERLLESLQGKGFLHGKGWTGRVIESLSSLRLLTTSTLLREVTERPIEAYHVQAAQSARHPAYQSALRWYAAFTDAIDHDDSERLAKVLSEGALRPGDEPKRFEIAVLLALIAGIEQRLAALGEYETSRDLVSSDRHQVATFTRPNGARVEVYYDQVVLPPGAALGPRDGGVSHYLASTGRLRPDITVRVQHGDHRTTHTVFEIKLSDDVGYAASGYAEAIVYRHEYATYLTGWPKAVLVTSQPIHGRPRREDDVIAVAWNELIASSALDGMLELATEPL
jgi:hypothetical protein